MKKQLAMSLILGSMMAVSASAVMADGIRLKAGLGTEQYIAPMPVGPSYKVNGTVMTLGGSYIFKESGIFVDFINRSSLGSSTTWNANEMVSSWSSGTVTNIPDQPAKFSDNSLTVGKMLGDGLFAFAGYQSQDTTGSFECTNCWSSNEKMTLSGLFVGVGKAFSFGPGWLTTTATLARPSADYSYTDQVDPTLSYTWSSAPGLGYSLGLSYSYPLTAQYDLVGEGKYQSYKPNGWDKANIVTVLGLNIVGKY